MGVLKSTSYRLYHHLIYISGRSRITDRPSHKCDQGSLWTETRGWKVERAWTPAEKCIRMKFILKVYRISLNSSKPIIQGLLIAFKSMKVGEVCWLKVQGHYNFVNNENVEASNNKTLYYKIEMVEILASKTICNNTKQEEYCFFRHNLSRMKFINDTRQQAMKLFQSGHLDQAIR